MTSSGEWQDHASPVAATALAAPGPVRVVGSPYRLDGERPRVRRGPPLLGEHTVEVLTALGLSAAQVEEVVGADGE